MMGTSLGIFRVLTMATVLAGEGAGHRGLTLDFGISRVCHQGRNGGGLNEGLRVLGGRGELRVGDGRGDHGGLSTGR